MANNSYTEAECKICPNSHCQFDHHAKGANFCILCGTLLYYRCDDCASVNPKYAKFCFYCGSNIADVESSAHYNPGFEDTLETQ